MAKIPTQTQDTLVEVPCSSPVGSVIEITEKKAQNPIDLDDDFNVYSYKPVDTIYRDSRFTLNNSKSMEMTNNQGIINLDFDDSNNSELFEVSQRDFMNSQKQKSIKLDLSSSPSPFLDSELNELHSAQSPQRTPYRSPLKQTHDTVASSSPSINNNTQPAVLDSIAPSAQLTSFRMQSPIKIRTTPKKHDLLVTQESFTVPNLISPSKSSNPTTPKTVHNSPSIYCTANESSRNSSPLQYEVKKSSVQFRGVIKTKFSSPFNDVQTKLLPVKRAIHSIDEEEVNGSGSSEDEDDSSISIIEITRTIKKPKPSVLQVISSPGFERLSSPTTSPMKLHNKSNNNNDNNNNNNDDDDNDDNDDNDKENANDEFDNMSMDEIRRKIMQYGLKPAKSRLKMVESLREVTNFLSQESIIKLSQSQNINHSQKLIKTDIFSKIDKTLTNDEQLMEKIYTFEPIKLTDLENCLRLHKVTINPQMLKEWCDRNSICLLDD